MPCMHLAVHIYCDQMWIFPQPTVETQFVLFSIRFPATSCLSRMFECDPQWSGSGWHGQIRRQGQDLFHKEDFTLIWIVHVMGYKPHQCPDLRLTRSLTLLPLTSTHWTLLISGLTRRPQAARKENTAEHPLISPVFSLARWMWPSHLQVPIVCRAHIPANTQGCSPTYWHNL